MTSFSRIFAIEVLTMYCLGCLVWTWRAPTPAILFQMKHPKNVFGRWRVPVKFTGKSNVIFSGPKLSCALRNTPKSFRELYGTVFVPEKFSGLLRNAIRLRLRVRVRVFQCVHGAHARLCEAVTSTRSVVKFSSPS